MLRLEGVAAISRTLNVIDDKYFEMTDKRGSWRLPKVVTKAAAG